jgi:TRAP-type mannitol/chloroaromatic compound transport system substrate-binding protein
MRRRKFLTTAGLGVAAASTLAAPAIAQSGELHWRMTTSWPKSLDTLYGGAEYVCKRVADMTGNKFQIRTFAGGEIVPGLQVADAVQNGTVEMGHTASYYYFGKDPTFAFDCAVPFGPNVRQHQSWIQFGGGDKLLGEFFREYNIISIPAGNTGCQMGGWFRREIKTVADLKGLKYRIGGFAGAVVAKLGVVPQQIAGGDIYPALEKGTIDAAEWVGPYDDEKLGFYKIAKFYYSPGWWEVGPQLSTYVNAKAWEGLTPEYRAIIQAACAEANTWMMAKYDAENPVALRRLIAGGTQLRFFSKEIMEASLKAANELYDETSDKNPKFKKIYENWRQFRNTTVDWFRVAENQIDDFMGSHLKQMQPTKKG